VAEIELSGGFDQCARTTSPSCVSDLVAWLFRSGDHIMCKKWIPDLSYVILLEIWIVFTVFYDSSSSMSESFVKTHSIRSSISLSLFEICDAVSSLSP
jgi:hypothetical protein